MRVIVLLLMCMLFFSSTSVASAVGSTIVFGDSNTAGSNWVPNDYDPAKKWVSKLEQVRPTINLGVAGNTTGLAKARMKSVLDKKPKTVTIMLGTNDAILNKNRIPKTSWRQFEIDLRYMVDKFRANGSNVVLMTTLPVIEEGKGYFYSRHNKNLYLKYGGAREFQDAYNNITRKVAREKGVPLVDTYKIFIRYAGSTKTDEALIKSNLIDPSGTHMSPYGASVLYKSLQVVLDKNKY